MHRFTILVVLIVAIIGCSIRPPASTPLIQGSHEVLTYSDATLKVSAKYFLVAGSAENANFAAEIVEQRRIWLESGVLPEEIECFYVRPEQEEFEKDIDQYIALSAELAKCHLASMKSIRQALLTAGREKKEFIYLYVTSHGYRPYKDLVELKEKPADKVWYEERRRRYPVLDRYRIALDALPDGTATKPEILGALRAGMDPDDLYLTPQSLTTALATAFPDVPKYVVLQGCFTGGFINGKSSLRTLAGVTVITASRHDRKSFGCHSGQERTFFGGVFNDLLKKGGALPTGMNWAKLYDQIMEKVAVLELERRGTTPSFPQYFQAVG